LPSDNLLEPPVLTLKLPQPLGALGLHPAILVTPPVQRGLRDLQVPHHLRDVLLFPKEPIGLAQLADDLLRGMTTTLHSSLLSPTIRRSDSQSTRTTQRGSRQ
jgi:hypothetical protein